MRAAPAIVRVTLLLGAASCTIGPVTDDGGTTDATSAAALRSRGDQCQSVLSAFCQKAGTCGLMVSLSDCLSGNMALFCCIGAACNATSTVSETAVTQCEQMITAEDCNDVVNTMNPTSCLGSP